DITLIKSHCLLHLKGVNKITNLRLLKGSTLNVILENDAKLYMETDWSSVINYSLLEFTSNNNTELNLKLFLEVVEETELKIKNSIVGNNNKTNIKMNVVTESLGPVKIESIGYIQKDTEENEFLEELKGLVLKNKPIIFLPNLIVEADAVVANHNATIRGVDEEELFYLQSKGLSIDTAKKLIKDGFLNKLKK
ncbi:MAG: hypothetical protein HFI09_01185, partial [Bacilli bacterium]|nr:hypothetical protein [Bacilli bacterium]